MGLGRRSAPSAPPIPSRPLPPSAYGIGVPGAPVAPGQQYVPPPTAPPAAFAVPAAFASPAAFAPPAPPEPSASRFGGYSGPADPFAPPPVAYGTSGWSPQPQQQRGSRLWVKIVAGVVVAVVGLGFLGHVYLAATKHHLTGGMPPTILTATLDTSDGAQAVEASVLASARASDAMSRAKNFQVGIYHDGNTLVVADMGEIPVNTPAFRDSLVNSNSSGETGMTFTSVPSGVKGGTESCGTSATATLCIWVDNGTFGVLGLNTVDLQGAELSLTAFRDQVEH